MKNHQIYGIISSVWGKMPWSGKIGEDVWETIGVVSKIALK